jgi:hypothetical protein
MLEQVGMAWGCQGIRTSFLIILKHKILCLIYFLVIILKNLIFL